MRLAVAGWSIQLGYSYAVNVGAGIGLSTPGIASGTSNADAEFLLEGLLTGSLTLHKHAGAGEKLSTIPKHS